MITKNYEQLLNQIGGTLESNQVATPVFGRNGRKARHSGIFSLDNPAYKLMMSATKNQDIDSLYDQAVQWEINNAILQEQRKYADPSADIARQRAAGYNPDIAGSSAGGSSAGSSPSMEPIQENIPTANAYDTADRVIAGVNSASTFIGSFGSFASGVSQALSAISLLGPNKRIADSEANVAERTEDARVALANEDARSRKISGDRSHLEYIHQLAGYTTEKTSDEELSSILSASGISTEDIPRFANDVRTLQRNPQMQALVEEGIKQRNQAEAYNNIFSRQVLENMYSAHKELESLTLQDNLSKSFIASEISAALAHNDEYINNQIDSALVDSDTQKTESQLGNNRIIEAYKSYGRRVQMHIEMLKNTQDDIKALEDEIETTKWDWTNQPEKAQKEGALAALRVKEIALYAYSANEYSILQHIYNTSQHLKYIEEFSNIGKPGAELISDSYVQFSNLGFNDVLNNNGAIPALLENFTGITLGDHFTTTDNNGNPYKINLLQGLINSLH